MAKAICICRRVPDSEPLPKTHIETLNRRLVPDNITPNPPLVFEEGGVTTALLNPTDGASRHGASVCLGLLIRPQPDWWQPRAAIPDGQYALFRSDAAAVELANDPVGTRTVWYVHTGEAFIASTSQRAIASILGSFEPNERAIPWMLSCGQLGPDNAYDRRVRVMRPNTRVLLDRASWRLSIEEMGNEIVPAERTREEHASGLRRVIEEIFASLDLDPARWVLPLSGGVDSRAILHWIKNRDKIRTVTWGVRSALDDKGTDAYVALQVAKHYGVKHRFFETDVSDEPADTIFSRFLVAGEGRVDAVAGYTDGFKMWKTLFEEGCAGVIRGDECFGMRMPVFTPFGVRRYVNCLLLSDYANVPDPMRAELPKQELPSHLVQRRGEPILRWRDRLYYNFRNPFVMAALTDLKTSYVEVANPFLSRSIVDYMRTVPDSLRLGRKPFMDVAVGLGPAIPYAERAAIDTSLGIFRTKPVVDMIQGELASQSAASVFSPKVIEFLRGNVRTRTSEAPASPETHKKYLVPAPIRKTFGQATRRPRGLLRDRFRKPVLDLNLMAFRAFIICRTHRMFEEDSRALGKR